MKPAALWALLVSCALTGCSAVSYYGQLSGKPAIKGDVIHASSFDYEVKSSVLRVKSDENGLVAYEDFGPGLSRGRTFVIRPGPAEKITPLHEDLRRFGKSPAKVLHEGMLVSTRDGLWRLRTVEFQLFEVPEISRIVDKRSRIVKRERTWVLGMIVPLAGQRYWISLTGTEEYFRPSDAIGGRNLRALLDFAEGLHVAEAPSRPHASQH